MAPGTDNSDTGTPKISLNGSASIYTPTVTDSITLALLQNGGVKRIQSTFQQRLDESGWTQALRGYVENLFRSGEATTYDDALKLVLARVKIQSTTANGANGEQRRPQDEEDEPADKEEGDSSKGIKSQNGVGAALMDLTIPREAAKDAAEVVKKELAQIVKLEK